jgi:hypothetical protein
MSIVPLAGVALFARAGDRTLRADPGCLPQRLVIAPLFFPDGARLETAAVRLPALAERVKALPGVRSVAFSEGIALFNRATVKLSPPGRTTALSSATAGAAADPGCRSRVARPLRPGYSSSSSSPALAARAAATIFSACKAGT